MNVYFILNRKKVAFRSRGSAYILKIHKNTCCRIAKPTGGQTQHGQQQKILINEISLDRIMNESVSCIACICVRPFWAVSKRFKFLMAAALIFIKLISLANAISVFFHHATCLSACIGRSRYSAIPSFTMKINRYVNEPVAILWNVKFRTWHPPNDIINGKELPRGRTLIYCDFWRSRTARARAPYILRF